MNKKLDTASVKAGPGAPWFLSLSGLSHWKHSVMEERRERIMPGFVVCPHFGLLQVQTNTQIHHVHCGDVAAMVPLIMSDVQAACLLSIWVPWCVTNHRQEILYAQK